MINLIATIVGLLVSVSAVAEFQVPATPNPVNDYAKVLTRGGKEAIAKSLVTLKQDTGAQFGVLIVDSLDGSSIEDASFRTATQWKLGSQDKDNGVLLFIAVKDRKIRLEIGKGLEGILTDYRSKQITAKMRTSLRSGDYDGAILVAVGGVSEAIRAHNQEVTSKSGSTGTTTEDSTGLNLFVGFLVLFGLGGLVATYISIVNKRREQERESRRLARQPQTPEQRELARAMYKDVSKRAVKDPGFPKKERKSRDDDDDGFTTGVVVGSLLSSGNGHSDDDDGGSFGGGSSDSGSSFGGSDFGGGGGDFGGGGSSDSF